MPPDDLDVPVRQGDDPLMVVLGKREDEDAAYSLDLPPDADDLLLVQVVVFVSQAEHFPFPYAR